MPAIAVPFLYWLSIRHHDAAAITPGPAGFAAERDRLHKEYNEAYQGFFRDYMPENGVPARFTVHLLDVPDKAASYEFYSTALFQKALQTK